ncbi:MAG: asparagine synthase (glutamine-hydrolyzing), partial [Chitinophagales bacterium]
MCGIAGILAFNRQNADQDQVRQMMNTMKHRGPDADGLFMDAEMGLGHRRLSIIDLSAAANQPFSDHAGRFTIIFNGEIYNYAQVKSLIKNYPFRTSSDTEVILAAYSIWGTECLHYFRGMFAFAIWDGLEKELFLVRDRMGVKPLYYTVQENRLIFASEIRAILATGLVERKLSQHALTGYFTYQSISGSRSAIESIQQLDAGSWMKIKNGKIDKQSYWDLTQPPHFSIPGNKPEVRNKIKALMLQSVERRLVSDVPVSAFLSGGIDSSALVGLMAEAGRGKPNTFTVAFEEKEFDESYYADQIAKKFGTHHSRILLNPENFLDELPNALNALDSPSGDGMNSYVVSKMVRKNGMKVALSGLGGDELFAGYPYFKQFMQIQRRKILWKLPVSIRRMLGSLSGVRKDRITQILTSSSCAIDQVYPVFRQILSPGQLDDLLIRNDSIFDEDSIGKILWSKRKEIQKLPLLSQVSAAEYLGYTQYTLLKDADQMSMAVSLELREPYFDQDLVEFVLALPDQIKYPHYPKSLLVESLQSLLPQEIIHRKKQGFVFPWKLWMKNQLRSFCESHIQRLCERTFIQGNHLAGFWKRFLKGDESIRWMEIWLFVVLEYW